MSASIQPLESRRLLTFAALDSAFGSGGVAALPYDAGYGVASVTPIADGRIVVADGHDRVRYLRGDGTLDPKRGAAAASQPANGYGLAAAVDPASGRLAILRFARSDGRTVTLLTFNPKGRPVGTRALAADFGTATAQDLNNAKIAIAADGSASVAVASKNGATAVLTLRHYDATLQPDVAFGTAGVATITRTPDASVGEIVGLGVSDLKLDGTGRAYVLSNDGQDGDSGSTSKTGLFRFTAAGAFDTSYGVAGFVTLTTYDEATRGSDLETQDILSLHVRPDGRAFEVERSDPADSVLKGVGAFTLRRVSPDGRTTTSAAVGRSFTTDGTIVTRSSAALGVSGDGDVYVSTTPYTGVASVFKFNDDATLSEDPSWSTFGDFVTTQVRQRSSSLAVDATGRVLLGGDATLEAITGPTDAIAATPGNSVRKLAGGTIFVNGTSRRDVIVVDEAKGKLRVTLNGATTKFATTYAGLVIRAGNGDDSITLGQGLDVAYVEAGAGDDTVKASGITGKFDGVTIVGGSGDDRLDGGSGTDHLYGQDGNDTLVGNDGADELFGGAGDDALYASKFVRHFADTTSDAVVDRLNSGAGNDVLHLDRAVFTDDGDSVEIDPGSVDLTA